MTARLAAQGGDSARLAVDIGGTFTDLALEHDGRRSTTKVLTTPAAPEQGVMAGVRHSGQAGMAPGRHRHRHPRHHARHQRGDRAQGRAHRAAHDQGFRDVIAMGNESRYDQYDLNIVLPRAAGAAPSAPAGRRNGWTTRATCCCRWTRPRCERQVAVACRREGVESIAVGLLHAFVNPAHERRMRDILAAALPGHPGIAVQRGLAGDARVGALLHHRRQRLCAAADGALSAAGWRTGCARPGLGARCS